MLVLEKLGAVQVDSPMLSLKKYFFDSHGIGKNSKRQDSLAVMWVLLVMLVSLPTATLEE